MAERVALNAQTRTTREKIVSRLIIERRSGGWNRVVSKIVLFVAWREKLRAEKVQWQQSVASRESQIKFIEKWKNSIIMQVASREERQKCVRREKCKQKGRQQKS